MAVKGKGLFILGGRSRKSILWLLVLVLWPASAAPVVGCRRPPLQRGDETPSPTPSSGRSSSSSAPSLFDEGLRELQQARYEQAIEHFQQALQLDPNFVLARYDLGVAYFASEKFEQAKPVFEEVLRQQPHHPFATYFLGRVELIQGNLDKAIRLFLSPPRQKPVADELYYLGSAYFRKGDTPQAIRTLGRAAAFEKGDYRVHLLLAVAYQRSGRGAEAQQELARSEKLRDVYRQKSQEIVECNSLLLSQKQEQAVRRCHQLLDGDDPTKLILLGILLGERRLYNLAIPPFTKAARLDPENYDPQFNLGLTYFRLKEYPEARKPLEAAVALRPESFDAVAMLGSVLFALGDDYGAVQQLSHAHQLRPGDEKVGTLLFEELGIISQHLLAEKKYKESIPYLKEALALRPDAQDLRSRLAEAHTSLGRATSPQAGEKTSHPANGPTH